MLATTLGALGLAAVLGMTYAARQRQRRHARDMRRRERAVRVQEDWQAMLARRKR